LATWQNDLECKSISEGILRNLSSIFWQNLHAAQKSVCDGLVQWHTR
jgi:hypothetical protein